MHDRVLEDRPLGGRRDTYIYSEQQALGQALLQLDGPTGVDQSHQCQVPVHEDQESAGTLDVRQTPGSHRYQTSEYCS